VQARYSGGVNVKRYYVHDSKYLKLLKEIPPPMTQRSDSMFALQDEEHTNRWRRLSNKELHNLYSTESIIWMILSMIIRQTGYMASMGRAEVRTEVWWET
jgi:hypothetical protein